MLTQAPQLGSLKHICMAYLHHCSLLPNMHMWCESHWHQLSFNINQTMNHRSVCVARAASIPCMSAVLQQGVWPVPKYGLFPKKVSILPCGVLTNFPCGFVQVWEGGVSGEWAGGDHLHPGLWHTPEPSGVSALARQHAKSQLGVSPWIRLTVFTASG